MDQFASHDDVFSPIRSDISVTDPSAYSSGSSYDIAWDENKCSVSSEINLTDHNVSRNYSCSANVSHKNSSRMQVSIKRQLNTFFGRKHELKSCENEEQDCSDEFSHHSFECSNRSDHLGQCSSQGNKRYDHRTEETFLKCPEETDIDMCQVKLALNEFHSKDEIHNIMDSNSIRYSICKQCINLNLHATGKLNTKSVSTQTEFSSSSEIQNGVNLQTGKQDILTEDSVEMLKNSVNLIAGMELESIRSMMVNQSIHFHKDFQKLQESTKKQFEDISYLVAVAGELVKRVEKILSLNN